jgi:hypothetical protein
MLPAQERLDTADGRAVHLNNGLIVKRQIIVGNRTGKVMREALRAEDVTFHRGVELASDAASCCLGGIESDIRAAHRLDEIGLARIGMRDAD